MFALPLAVASNPGANVLNQLGDLRLVVGRDERASGTPLDLCAPADRAENRSCRPLAI
jgi:hypothetical protein